MMIIFQAKINRIAFFNYGKHLQNLEQNELHLFTADIYRKFDRTASQK